MDTVLRVLLTYFLVVALVRVAGKRTFGEMSAADLVVLMLIPEFLQQAVIRDDFSMTNGFLAVCTLVLVAALTDTVAHRFPWLEDLIAGKPVTVAARGRLRERELNLERLSPEELMAAVHQAGLERLDQVRWAVLLPDGTIAVVPEKGSSVEHRRQEGSEGRKS